MLEEFETIRARILNERVVRLAKLIEDRAPDSLEQMWRSLEPHHRGDPEVVALVLARILKAPKPRVDEYSLQYLAVIQKALA